MALNNNSKTIATELVFPFWGIFRAIKTNAVQVIPVVFALFFFYIGTQLIVTDSNDFGVYVQSFLYLAGIDNVTFEWYFLMLDESNQIDFYLPFMTWLISRFTNNTQIFAGILAMIMGLCYGFNFAYIVKKVNKDHWLILVLIFLLFLVPRASLCTHRWWTALQVFLLGALPFILDGKNKQIVFSFASIFIHFSFLYPLVLLILVRFLPRNKLLPYVVLFLIINLIDSINIQSLSQMVSGLLPESFNNRNESYINAEFLDHNLFSQSYKIVWKYVNMFLVIYLYIKRKVLIETNEQIRDLFVVSLLIGSFVAMASMTEWGGRYGDLNNFLFCTLYLLLLSNAYSKNYKYVKVMTAISPFLIYNILFQVRGLLAVIGPKAFLWGNIFSTWFIEDTVSILSIVK